METCLGFIRPMIPQFPGCKTSQWRHSWNEKWICQTRKSSRSHSRYLFNHQCYTPSTTKLTTIVRPSARSSVISRPTCFSSSLRCCMAGGLSTVRPAPLWLFSEFAAVFKYSDLLTYLFVDVFFQVLVRSWTALGEPCVEHWCEDGQEMTKDLREDCTCPPVSSL